MSFRFVPKSVTLNDLERRNGRYFALFQRIRVASGCTAQKFTFAISSTEEFLLFVTRLVLRQNVRYCYLLAICVGLLFSLSPATLVLVLLGPSLSQRPTVTFEF